MVQEREEAIIFAPETEQYGKFKLDESQLDPNPVLQFEYWFEDAKKAQIDLPESLVLSTAHLPSGRVSARTVLMKELDKYGSMIVYSNWQTSKKAKDIATNEYVALTFFWKELERQVRIEGTCERLTTEESQIYFDKRPRASRIGAWASPQSSAVESRQQLDEFVQEQGKRFEGQEHIPCPPFWGGLRIRPLEWEFFQGRTNRVHDRFTYTKQGDEWIIQRLAP